jgi:DNA-directed RNA polymerase subunit RPC12/RpoP
MEAIQETSVRCLECGTVYTPAAESNAPADEVGCPVCGSLSWLAAHVPVGDEFALRRSDAGPRLRRDG